MDAMTHTLGVIVVIEVIEVSTFLGPSHIANFNLRGSIVSGTEMFNILATKISFKMTSG